MGTDQRSVGPPPRRYAGGPDKLKKNIESLSHNGKKTFPLFASQGRHSTSSSSSLFYKRAAGEKEEAARLSEPSSRRRVQATERHEREGGRGVSTGTEREQKKIFVSGKRRRAEEAEEEAEDGKEGEGGRERRRKGLFDKKKNLFFCTSNSSLHEKTEKVTSVAADYKSSRLFIRNLPPFVSAAELKESFSSLGGEVTDVCLLVNDAGRSRQCAFMGFKTQAQAAAAKEYFNATFFYTRRITVDFALPRHALSAKSSSRLSSASLPSLSSSSSPSSTLSASPVSPEGSSTQTRVRAAAKRTPTGGEDTGVAAKAACSQGNSSNNKDSQQESPSSRYGRRKGNTGTANKDEEEHKEEDDRAAGACIVVEEEAVHARKAGVSGVRKRVLFQEFFSSSDEEKEENNKVKDLKTTQKGKAGIDEDDSSTSSIGNTLSQQRKKKKKRKRGTDVAGEDEGDVASSAAIATATATATAATATIQNSIIGTSAKAAGILPVASFAAKRNFKNTEKIDSTAAVSSRGENRGKKSNKKETLQNSSKGGEESTEEVDDLTWLRQASAVAVAEEKKNVPNADQKRSIQQEERGSQEEKEEAVLGGRAEREEQERKNEEEEKEEQEKKKKKNEEEESALSSLGVHGRLLLRNFPYITKEEELEALCAQYGEVAEIHVVYDEETKKSKGYAFVTFVFPEHAVNALSQLNGIIFQGRLLHAEAAKPDQKKEARRQQREKQEEEEEKKKKNKGKASGTSSYKRKKQEELLKQHVENEAYMEEKVWNLLYVSANAAVDAVAKEFHIDKGELLYSDESGRGGLETTAAARVALAETHLLQATKEWIIKEGISPEAFERRGQTLLSATTPSSSSSTLSSSSSGVMSDDKMKSILCTGGRGLGEKEEESQGVRRSRDTLIVKHLPTAHVVGAELLLLFEKIGKVERFLLAPSKTVAIVQYENERDATTAFRRLAYRKYKNVPLFLEKAPVNIFVGESEERKQAFTEAAEEAKAASHADALLAAMSGLRDKNKEKESGRSLLGDRSGEAAERPTKGARARDQQDKGGEDREDEKLFASRSSSVVSGIRIDGNPGKRSKDDMMKKTNNNDDVAGGCTPHSGAVTNVVGSYATSSASLSAGAESTDARETEEEEDNENVAGGYSLFVKNLNFSTTETALREVFSPCLGLRKVKLMTKKKPSFAATKTIQKEEEREGGSTFENVTDHVTLSLGYAFVEFDSVANAEAACKRMQNVVVDGHPLKISISRSSTLRQRNRYFSVNVTGSSNGDITHQLKGQGGAGLVKTAAAAKAAKSRKLLVRNLAFQATTADLRGLFSAYGNVTRVCIPTQHEGRSRGFGFVDFSTRFEAAAALQALSGTHLYGRKLVLEAAAPDTEGGSTTARA